MNTGYKICLPPEIKELKEPLIIELAKCYRDVFNHFWDEDWTTEGAISEVKESLLASDYRLPLLSLMFNNSRIVGFAWVILTKIDMVDKKDLPFGLSEVSLRTGLQVLKHWFALAGLDKVIIYKEIGILSEFQTMNGEHAASRLSIPLIKEALDRGYRAIYYWSQPDNASYKQGLGFGWHPIHFFIPENRVLMTGSAVSLLRYLNGVLGRDREIIKEMANNRAMYFCKK